MFSNRDDKDLKDSNIINKYKNESINDFIKVEDNTQKKLNKNSDVKLYNNRDNNNIDNYFNKKLNDDKLIFNKDVKSIGSCINTFDYIQDKIDKKNINRAATNSLSKHEKIKLLYKRIKNDNKNNLPKSVQIILKGNNIQEITNKNNTAIGNINNYTNKENYTFNSNNNKIKSKLFFLNLNKKN